MLLLAVGIVIWNKSGENYEQKYSKMNVNCRQDSVLGGEPESAQDLGKTTTGLLPEQIAQVKLPDIAGFDVNKFTLAEMDEILVPLFESLFSENPARQRAALLIMGVHQGSMKNVGTRYDTMNSVLMRWAGNAVVDFSNHPTFTSEMRKASKKRNEMYLTVMERLISLNDANNSLLVKMALQPLLGMPAAIIYRDNGLAMREAWHSTPTYKKLAAL